MKPLINFSLDLDNKWSYLKTAGRPAWKKFPSYLPTACAHIRSILGDAGVSATLFVVGQDLLCSEDKEAVCSLATAGHDLGNHSFHHEPWLHLYDREQIAYELDKTDELLAEVGGRHSLGFRGPGYSDSSLVHEEGVNRETFKTRNISCAGINHVSWYDRRGLARCARGGFEAESGSGFPSRVFSRAGRSRQRGKQGR